MSTQTWNEVQSYLVPQITPPQTTASVTGASVQQVGQVECGWQVTIAYPLTGLDCRVTAGIVQVYWDQQSPPPDTDGNGIPDQVEAYAEGFLDAQDYFEDAQGLAYPPIGHVDALLLHPGVACGLSAPTGTIFLGEDCAEPAYLAMHELFHQYQWDYLGPFDFTFGESTREIAWWGEATAEWAAHQVLAANDAKYAGTSDRFAYDDRLPAFVNTSWQNIDDSGRQAGVQRQYGAFVVAEWLHHVTGDPAVIRRTFENISLITSPTEAIDGELAGTWNAQIPEMWRDLYFLDLPITGRVDQTETDAWRQDLPEGGVFGTMRRPDAEPVVLESGDSDLVTFQLGAAGAKFIEVDSDDHGPLEVIVVSSEPSVDLQVLALQDYDTDPDAPPSECAPSTVVADSPNRSTGSVQFSPVTCDGVVLIVSKTDKGAATPTDVAVQVSLGDRVDTTISNGTVRLGVHAEGHLNVDGYEDSSGTGTSVVGLRYVPTNADALAPGCLCEGWGIADLDHGFTGSANESDGGVFDLTVEHADFDATRGTSTVLADDIFRVTHDFFPSPDTANLYQIDVTIENAADLTDWASGGFFGPVTPTYRRVMDWDVEPTAFSEYVTIDVPGRQVPDVLAFSSNDGFAPADPLAGPSDIGAVGLFVDEGPYDHGALFDLQLPELDPGQAVTFTMFYGAAANETDALAALTSADATLYSLAQPDLPDGATAGTPNTFVWAYRPYAPPVIATATAPTPAGRDRHAWQATLPPPTGDPAAPSPNWAS